MFGIVLAFITKSSYSVIYYVFKNVSWVLIHLILMLISKFCNMKTCRIKFLNIINSTLFLCSFLFRSTSKLVQGNYKLPKHFCQNLFLNLNSYYKAKYSNVPFRTLKWNYSKLLCINWVKNILGSEVCIKLVREMPQIVYYYWKDNFNRSMVSLVLRETHHLA